MSKKLPKRYLSETAVKKALRIDSFRNLSKEKVMQFASMIPYIDKEVAIAIINQFPVYADFGKMAIESYMQICNNILEKNKESQICVIQSYQMILEALSARLSNEKITEEERKSITDDMISIADKIAVIDMKNKNFLDKMSSKILYGIFGVVALIGTGIGISSMISNSGEIPEISEDEESDVF